MSLIIRNIRDARVAHFNDIPLPLTYRHKKFPLSSVVATGLITGNDPSNDRCIVYKGYAEDDPSTLLALKFGAKELQYEASMYQKLRSVQGSVLPRCYGLTSFNNHSRCLIIQHCGSSIQKKLRKLPRPEKKTILMKLAELHADKSRAIVRQLQPGHILKNSDGEIRIINPRHFDMNHKNCNNLDSRWLETPLDSRTSKEALSMCIELWHNAYDTLEYWDNHVFRPKAGVPYSIDKLPKYVVYDLNPDVRRRSDRCQITKLEEDEVLNLYYERIYWLLDEYSLAELYQARRTILDEVIANWRLTHPVGEF